MRRADRTSPQALSTMLVTLAELLHAAGEPDPVLGSESTTRQTEIAMEARFVDVPRSVHSATHVWEVDDPWTFLLTDNEPAEMKYLTETPMQNLNKMALARLAELTKHANKRETFGLPNKA